MKSIVQKKVNLFLVLLVSAVVIVILAMSTFFQATLRNVTTEYTENKESLQICEADLSNYKSQLDVALQTINSSVQDIEKYDTLYENKTEELQRTSAELQSTEDELEQTKTALSNYKTLYEQEQGRYEELESDYESLESDYDDVLRQYNNAQVTIDELTLDLSRCENSLEDCEEDLDEC